MRKLFELLSLAGVVGYLITRFFFYEYKTLMFIFGGLAVVGLIGRWLTRESKNV
ncbi:MULTISPECIES: hypothetical protein [Paenibacillus]|uniref:Uncharacterized protein n=1 Tax=Paenibacillus woosongensis TaxID=307580 RepID=A0ABQ4MQZ7_9BACL|nr:MULTISPECIES: hypothetical protein [Paenibacillus]GIP58429.1 hypothetical protein J15TS10_22430 [Paenibacillus woosongensis]